MSDIFSSLPPAGYGQRIGLYGGSFDPPHEGHLLVASRVMQRLQLDWLWVLVTPGNPLKGRKPSSQEERLAALSDLLQDRRYRVCTIENTLPTNYTAQTLNRIKALRPDLHLVWVMGADNLAGFHHWHHWQAIAETMPLAVIDRPGFSHAPLYAPFAQRYSQYRVDEADASALPFLESPAWVMLRGPMNGLSSTALRNEKH